MERWTYALLLAGSIAIPLIRSFEHRVSFKSKWPALFTGVFFMMLVFIPWDIWFTAENVWHFNHEFVSGSFIAGLPVEEWLFFIVIPYAVIFIHEVLKYFFPDFHYPKSSRILTIILAFAMILMAVINTGNLYTFIVGALTAVLLLIQIFPANDKKWLSHFFLTYGISIIPFMIVNGVLTAFPVVIYNNSQNLSIRLMTIPVEDFAYLMSMMLIVTMVYEYILRRKKNFSRR